MGIIGDLKSCIAFLTVLPVESESLESAARGAWFFPIAGVLIAAIAGLIWNASQVIFPAAISAAIALFALLLLTGFHHLDGLLDFGDAAMFRGSAERRREIMKDVNTGAGGFALGFFVLLLTYLSLTQFGNLLPALVIAEASAKFSMNIIAYVAKPSHEGMGSTFIGVLGRNHNLFFASLLLYALIVFPFLYEKGVLILALVYVLSLLIVSASNRLLGGAGGDVFGAANELTRCAVLLTLVAMKSA